MVELGHFLVCLALVVTLAYQQRLHVRQNALRDKEWALERGALLTRIQHPEVIVSQAREIEVPDEEFLTAEPDEIDLVGKVQTGNGNGD